MVQVMEQQFARFLLDRIEEEVDTVPEQTAGRIRLHLKELRGIVDTALQSAPTRGRKGGGSDV
jgi:hypothetical protein